MQSRILAKAIFTEKLPCSLHNKGISEKCYPNSHCTENESFPLRISLVNMTKSAPADLVTFTEEIFIRKLKFHFLCCELCFLTMRLHFLNCKLRKHRPKTWQNSQESRRRPWTDRTEQYASKEDCIKRSK